MKVPVMIGTTMSPVPTRIYVLVVVLYLFTYLAPLGMRPLIIPDESRYAETPREMVASGDWIVPRLNGVRYFEKPVLGYWLNALSIRLLGENRFAVRLPAALAAGLTALLVFMLVRRYGNDEWGAVFSSGMFLTTLFVYAVGTFAVLDMPLTLFLTGANICFYFAYREQGGRRRLLEACFGGFCGLAFLTKGFLAFAVPVVTIVPFMFWEKRWRELFTMVWIPLLTAVFVALPWGIAIHLREPDFWRFFFWHEHVQRFFSDHAQHPEAFWFFVPVLIACLLPWTFVLPAAIAGLRKREFLGDSFLRYCLCWFIFPFLFFSASRGKLATYILPCFPPLAVLMAVGLLRYLDGTRRRVFNAGAYAGAGLVTLLSTVLIIHECIGLELLPVYNDGKCHRWILAGFALFFWGGAFLLSGVFRETGHKLLSFCLGPVVFMAVAGFIFPAEAGARKAPEEFLEKYAKTLVPGTRVAVDHNLVRAVCWVWKRQDLLVIDDPGELEYGLEQPDARGRHLTVEQLADLIRTLQPGQCLVLAVLDKHFRRWEEQLPPAKYTDTRQGFIYAEFSIE